MLFFCDPQSARLPHFPAPWVCDGWRYATDGAIVIRRPACENEEPTSDIPSSTVSEVFDAFPVCDQSIVLSGETQEVKCEACLGIGMVTENCGTCKGSGNHVCTCGRRHKCGVCGGKGHAKKVPHEKCPICQGKKRLAFPADQFIFGNLLSGTYLGRIFKYLPAPYAYSRSRNQQEIFRHGLPFRAGCYQGFLMPLSKG
jgi:hypothetical protein